MRNKQHEYILRAFSESKIPEVIKSNAPELISIDSVLGGYCSQLLSNKRLNVLTDLFISDEDKKKISDLINKSKGKLKQELIIYYRLAILAETIINEYKDV